MEGNMLPACEMNVVRERIEELHRQAARAAVPAALADRLQGRLRRAVGQRLQVWGERLVESSMPRVERGTLAGDCDC
jgi:hypothetical protein